MYRSGRRPFPAVAAVAVALGFGCLAPAPADAQLPSTVDEPFHGLTTDGELTPGLFTIRETGVSTAPVVDAARAFLETLDADQREATTFPLDDDEFRHWANFPQLERRGVPLREMTEAQREAAFDLVRAGLSAKGFERARDIMRTAGYVAELMDNYDIYGEHLYFVTMMGEPSADEPWGWQLDGYHLVINYFVQGDQVVMTPRFMGTEPAELESGPDAGTEVLQEEQDRGLALMRSLRPDQRREALLGEEKTGNDIRAAAFQDNLVLEYAGIRADRLDAAQRQRLLELIGTYVENLPEGHAEIRMDHIREHLDETHFAWIGGTEEDAVFYYRIHGPVILVEFDHTVPVVLDPGDPPRPSRQHIHSVVRTPNGNDYGKALLQQHYEAHADDPDHDHGDAAGGGR